MGDKTDTETLEVNYPPVLTKKDFVVRYKNGEFGNASPSWNTLQEYKDSGYCDGLIHIRNRIAGGHTWYDTHPSLVSKVWRTALEAGYSESDLYISAMAPTEKTIFQGEVQQSPVGLQLYYTTVAKPMRDALKTEAEQIAGLRAVGLLRYYLCPKSYDWINTLLDRYPGHVVEFSTYGVEWGTLPGFNTVFWEVRLY